MALRINYNQAASIAQRGLAGSQDAYSRMAERLSTGLRINRASDDAAGMAVSEKLKNQIRGLNQAQRNAQDSISLIQTAEGALAETHSLLSRIRELSVQSANDTLTASDRANLQAEVNQLVSEVDRIASTAQFNGIALLNKNSTVSTHDSGDGLQFQIGANSSSVANNLTLTIGGARTQDLGSVKTLSGINSAITSGTFTVGSSTVTYDASVDTVFDVRDLINADTATHGATASVANGTLTLSASSAVVVADGTGNLASTLGFSGTAAVGSVSGSSTLASIGVTAGGTLTIATAATAAAGSNSLGDLGTVGGTLSFTAQVAAGTATTTSTLAELGVSAGGTLTLAFDDGTGAETRSVAVTYATGDTLGALATRIDTAVNEASALLASGTTAGGMAVIVGGPTTAGTATLQDLGVAGSGTVTIGFDDGTGTETRSVAVSYTDTDTITSLKSLIDTAITTAASMQSNGAGIGFTYTMGGPGSGANSITLANATTTTYAAGVFTIDLGAGTPFITDISDSGATTSGLLAALNLAPISGAVSGTSAASSAAVTKVTTAISLSSASTAFSAGSMNIDVGSSGARLTTLSDSGTALAALNLSAITSGSGTSTASSGTVNTAIQSETVTVSYTAADTLTGLATNIQSALQTAGAVGDSTLATGTLTNATASFGSGVLAIDADGSGVSSVTFSAIAETGSGTARTVLGGLATGAQVTSTNSISPAATENVAVNFATTDTLTSLATTIQTALRGSGAVGSSLIGSLTGAANADFGTTAASTFTIAVTDPDVSISGLTETGGGLIAALGLTGLSGASVASASALTSTTYTLTSSAIASGITSLSSGTGSTLNISTRAAASASIATVDEAINQVSSLRANLGAAQNRLESTIRSLGVASENSSAANSRIADADIAASMSELVRSQILQQAGVSVLAQANQAPSLVLQLLR
ncbi:MAG: flagellin [Chloroflexota bacterium]